MESLNFKPIGYFRNSMDNPYEAPRQPNPDLSETAGYIELSSGHHFEDALRDLDGFTKIWVIFKFHKNDHWNPLVQPPRGSDKKRGVFATRSPHRPNPIGMSVLDLISIDGLKIDLGPTDLLNGTPILDIKPYLSYVDAHPGEKIGWIDKSAEEKYSVLWHSEAQTQLEFLESHGLRQLRGFVVNQLEYDPANAKKKRLYFIEGKILLAYRTWRVEIEIIEDKRQVQVLNVKSAYTAAELSSNEDRYDDKTLHRLFREFLSHSS
jgi:tRNA-Thr(GGU) m(6)t(6)A37 methyltransferase TsaA